MPNGTSPDSPRVKRIRIGETKMPRNEPRAELNIAAASLPVKREFYYMTM